MLTCTYSMQHIHNARSGRVVNTLFTTNCELYISYNL